MRHEVLLANLQQWIAIKFSFTLVQEILQLIRIWLGNRITHGLPKKDRNPAAIRHIKLHGRIHDGFVGGFHEVSFSLFLVLRQAFTGGINPAVR